MNALELRHVTKGYRDFTLKDVSFALPQGCIMGLIGENGAGKSTTIKLILDTIRRDAGEIDVLGKDNREDFVSTRQDVGVILDEACFPEGLTARQIGNFLAKTYLRWDDAAYSGYMRRFSLPENKPFKTFSRGMKMKLAFAAALSHHPRLLILDEATSGLDPVARDDILDLLMEYTREENHSVLISSHIVSDLEKVCDYIVFLHKGRLKFCEEKDRLLERYGLLHLSKAEQEQLDPAAIMGQRAGGYGVTCLADRLRLPSSMKTERATIEDIILYMTKGDSHP